MRLYPQQGEVWFLLLRNTGRRGWRRSRGWSWACVAGRGGDGLGGDAERGGVGGGGRARARRAPRRPRTTAQAGLGQLRAESGALPRRSKRTLREEVECTRAELGQIQGLVHDAIEQLSASFHGLNGQTRRQQERW